MKSNENNIVRLHCQIIRIGQNKRKYLLRHIRRAMNRAVSALGISEDTALIIQGKDRFIRPDLGPAA